jgi:hypothetical protein
MGYYIVLPNTSSRKEKYEKATEFNGILSVSFRTFDEAKPKTVVASEIVMVPSASLNLSHEERTSYVLAEVRPITIPYVCVLNVRKRGEWREVGKSGMISESVQKR